MAVEVFGTAERDLRPMSEGELKGILNAKVTNSLGYYGGKLSRERVNALQYYNGEPFGNEQDGRSKVVSRDVAEAIDSAMPSLVRIFTSSDQVVRFEATKPEDEEIAKQATDYVSWIWSQQNKGFLNTYTWFKDALLNRSAALKIWWDTQLEVAKETYRGLTDAEFSILMKDAEDEDLEIIEHVAFPDPLAPPASRAPPMMPGNTQEPEPQAPMLHDVVLRRTNRNGRVHIMPLPGEEFLMDRRAISLEETPFVAHRSKKTISDLVEMGYPYEKVRFLGEGDSADFNPERLERFRQEDEMPYRTGNTYDPSMKEVWINECYLKVDFDGDGIAELRKVTFAGESGNFAPGATVILGNEEVDDHPFVALTPIPMPHKFYGMSFADQTKDLQLIKSVLFRTVLDHGYNAIMPQVIVDPERVSLDDLLTRRPGGVVRAKGDVTTAVAPLPNGQLGVDPFQLISYVDQVREERTGVRRFTPGPGADTLQNAYTQTATGANLVENSTQERLELVARCFAEIGMKPAFRKILKLVTQNQTKPKIVRLRDKFVAMDPREWDTEFDTTVTVGLGTGNRQQQVQGIGMLLQLAQKIIELQGGITGPMVTLENVFNMIDRLCSFLGLRNATEFFNNPQGQPPKPPQQHPDPKIVAAQIGAQSDAQKAKMQASLEMQKLQMQMGMDAQKTRFQTEADMRVAMAKIAAQREVDYARIAAERDEFNAQAQLDLHKHETDRLLRTRSIDNDMKKHEQDDDFRKRTTSGYQPPPVPKIAKITLHRDENGRTLAAQRHYEDGTSEMVPIERSDSAV